MFCLLQSDRQPPTCSLATFGPPPSGVLERTAASKPASDTASAMRCASTAALSNFT